MTEDFQENSPTMDTEILFPEEELKRLKARRWILNYAKKGTVGAEIGVFRGHFSAVLSEVIQPKKMYLVDPWRKCGKDFGWGKDSPYTGFGRLTTEYAYRDTIRRVSNFKNIEFSIFEGFAEQFLGGLTEQLDWVYLDASHSYKATLNELKLIDNVLKSDGVIIGDDWQPDRGHKHHGVFRAVHDFIRVYPYEIVAAGPASQWCLRRVIAQDSSGAENEVLNPWILHAEIDGTLDSVSLGQQVDIGGVVVLSEQAPKEVSLQVRGTQKNSIKWNIPSPLMAKKYRNSPNSTTSRFRLKDFRLDLDMPLEIYLLDNAGKEVVIFKVLPHSL